MGELICDDLANSICHARMTSSGIHDSDRLQSGLPIKIDPGMTICESVIYGLASMVLALRRIISHASVNPTTPVSIER